MMQRKYILAAVAAVTFSGLAMGQMANPDREQPLGQQAQMGQQPLAGQQPQTGQQWQQQAGAMADAASQMQLTDQQFVQKASSANNFEIQLSQIGERKLDDPQLRQMAKDMLKDHRESQQKLSKIAQKNDIKYSSGVTDPQQKQILEDLKNKSGDDFQQAFLQDEQQAHQKTIALFKQAQIQVKNQELKDYAQMSLPTLQEHLTMVQHHQQGSAQPAGAQMPGMGMGQDKANPPYSPDEQARPNQQQQNQPAQDQPGQQPVVPHNGDIPDRPEH